MRKIKQSYAIAGVLAVAAIGAMAVLSSGNVVTWNDGKTELGVVQGSTTQSGLVGSTTPSTIKTFDPQCVVQAVDQREYALLPALDARNSAIRNAVQTRDESQKAAWWEKDNTKRRTALRNILTNYSKEITRVNKDWRTAKSTIWKKYATDRKACGPTAANEDSNSSESLDSQI